MTLVNSPVAGQITVTAVVNGKRAHRTQDLREYLAKYAGSFDRDDGKRVKSLYLWSDAKGVGKTTTACALLNEWLASYYVRTVKAGGELASVPAYLLDVNEWQEHYNGFARPNVPADIAEGYSRKYYRQMETAKQAKFLVCDDIGIRDATLPFKADLHTIINYRTANELATVYTSNIDDEDIAGVFDDRLADRIRDMCFIVQFAESQSKRGIRK